jgi:hypothetical protein
MMRKLIPVVLAVAGLGAGIAAGLWLRPDHDATDTAAQADDAGATPEDAEDAGAVPEFVKLSNQFVVPVVDQGRVAAMVVLSLSLEIEEGGSDAVFAREPKLRDMFLQVLFDHANVGGFSGSFTDGSNLIVLRNSLKEAANMVLGTVVKDVLIIDIARQDS